MGNLLLSSLRGSCVEGLIRFIWQDLEAKVVVIDVSIGSYTLGHKLIPYKT